MKLAEAVLREVADFKVVDDRFQVRIHSCRHVVDLLSMSSASQSEIWCAVCNDTRDCLWYSRQETLGPNVLLSADIARLLRITVLTWFEW